MQALYLPWADLDLQRGKLNVRRTLWRGVVGLPKGGRERTVDLPAPAVEALKGHRHLCGVDVFCLPDGRPLTAEMTKHPLLRALRRAGVSRPEGSIGWHGLRHTYGSHLAMRGVALKAIQELMGHATIETWDEQYAGQVRLTLEQDERRSFHALTCGISGWELRPALVELWSQLPKGGPGSPAEARAGGSLLASFLARFP